MQRVCCFSAAPRHHTQTPLLVTPDVSYNHMYVLGTKLNYNSGHDRAATARDSTLKATPRSPTNCDRPVGPAPPRARSLTVSRSSRGPTDVHTLQCAAVINGTAGAARKAYVPPRRM